MYAQLPARQQAKVFLPSPPNTRKCILATNIAETSITIPGIKYVIDTGKCKEKRYMSRDIGGGFDTLRTKDITQSSAMQRAGRAGREGPGSCFRLYTQDAFKEMDLTADPEILRRSFVGSLLQLVYLGQDPDTLELMDQPDDISKAAAWKTLFIMGAIDAKRALTPLGRDLATFPLEPEHARIVLASRDYSCTRDVLDIVSVLASSSKLFIESLDDREASEQARSKFRHPTGDHLTILNVVRAYEEVSASEKKAGRKHWCRQQFVNERCLVEAFDIREQLRVTCKRMGIDWNTSSPDNEDSILHSFWKGLTQNSALLQPNGTYRQTMGKAVSFSVLPFKSDVSDFCYLLC
jgi:ATP-dependent RNA helicase DHX33